MALRKCPSISSPSTRSRKGLVGFNPTFLRSCAGRLRTAWLPAMALATGVLLLWPPLLRSIDYPLSLVASPVLAMLAAIMGVLEARRRPLPEGLLSGLMQIAAGTILVALPAALASGLSGKVCEPLYGLLFLLLGPLCSGTMGLILGHALATFLRPRLALALVPLLLLGSAAIALAEFFWTPGVRFYGTLYGLYHGAVYDEAVFVEWPYAALRAWNLCGAVALIAGIGAKRRTERRWWVASLVMAVVWLGVGLAGPGLGFINSTSRLEGELAGSLATTHFEIRFKPGGKAEKWAPLMALDLEYRGSQIMEFYDLPEPSEPITAFLYESPEHKASLMGAGRTSIAKPWLRQIHIHTHEVGGRLLHHELAHAMLADVTDSLLGMPADGAGIPRPGILEGAAVAVERGGETLTTHQWARAMREVGMLPDMPSILEQLSFWSQSSSRAYIACGSFIRYLVESRGATPFLALYRDASFAEAYGLPLAALLKAWNDYLDQETLSAQDLELARFAFSRPPVFARQCPYAGGRCLHRAQLAAALGDAREAAAAGAQGLRVTGVDLSLGRRLVRILLAVNAVDETMAILELMRRHHPNPGIVAEQSLRLVQGDAAWLQGSSEEAIEVTASLHGTPFARLASPAVEMRLALLAEQPPEAVRRLALGAVVRSEIPSLLATAKDSLPSLGPVGTLQIALVLSRFPSRQLHAMSLCTTELLEALPRALRFEGALLQTRLAVMVGDLELAENTVQTLAGEAQSDARKELQRDWRERIKWLRKIAAGTVSRAGKGESTSAEAGSTSTRSD